MTETKKIYCERCGQYQGEINKAKLRKGTAYLCEKCNTARKALEIKEQFSVKSPLDELFGGIFK